MKIKTEIGYLLSKFFMLQLSEKKYKLILLLTVCSVCSLLLQLKIFQFLHYQL